jgi:hypothetical protein
VSASSRAIHFRRATGRPLGLARRKASILVEEDREIADPTQDRRHRDHPIFPGGEAGPHGVHRHIAGRREEVALIHLYAAEPALPQMAGPLEADVDPAPCIAGGLGIWAESPV